MSDFVGVNQQLLPDDAPGCGLALAGTQTGYVEVYDDRRIERVAEQIVRHNNLGL